MVQREISEEDKPTIWLGATPSGLISDQPPSSPHNTDVSIVKYAKYAKYVKQYILCDKVYFFYMTV